MGPQIREAELPPTSTPSTRSVSALATPGAMPATLYDDPRLLGEVYVGPYVMLDGAIGLAAVDDDGPAGYALAALDTRQFRETV